MTERLSEARRRLDSLAGNLAAVLGPAETGISFAAVGATLLAQSHGRAEAAGFLRALADELEEDSDPGWGGTA